MTETTQQTFGSLLREFRIRAGLSQMRLAAEMRDIDGRYWSGSTISRLESGERNASAYTVDVLATALGLDERDRFRFASVAGVFEWELSDEQLDRVWQAIEAEVTAGVAA